MAFRPNPYGAFNFRVNLGTDGDDTTIIGGFSDVSGLGNEVKFSEYRNGNDGANHVRKIANINSTDDVTLKRGWIDNALLFSWIKATREGEYQPRTVVITLLDESAGKSVCQWTLQAAQPKKWVGPTLTAKGGGEVAMEELHLVAESIEYSSL